MRLSARPLLPAFGRWPARLAAPFALLALALAGCGMPMHNIQAENRAFPWSGQVAACDDGQVLGAIQRRFARSESQIGHDGLGIQDFTTIRQTSLRKNGPAYIPRRGCVANVLLSDTRRVRVFYTTVAQTGAYSVADGVEFCVEGHDHAHLGDPACTRMTR